MTRSTNNDVSTVNTDSNDKYTTQTNEYIKNVYDSNIKVFKSSQLPDAYRSINRCGNNIPSNTRDENLGETTFSKDRPPPQPPPQPPPSTPAILDAPTGQDIITEKILKMYNRVRLSTNKWLYYYLPFCC